MRRLRSWSDHTFPVPRTPGRRDLLGDRPSTAFPTPSPQPASGPRKEQIDMALSTSSGAAPAAPGSPRASWWGDRGVRTKVLTAVGTAAAAAVAIGVLGLTSLDSAAA